eukprot:scaffold75244_cov20-Tisochrysis_lutea.AAC.5
MHWLCLQERLANMVESAGPGGSKAAAAATAAGASSRGKSPKERYEAAGHVKWVVLQACLLYFNGRPTC